MKRLGRSRGRKKEKKKKTITDRWKKKKKKEMIENGKENNASPSWEEECWDKRRHKWWLETGVHQSTQTPTCEEGGTLVVASIKTSVHQRAGD